MNARIILTSWPCCVYVIFADWPPHHSSKICRICAMTIFSFIFPNPLATSVKFQVSTNPTAHFIFAWLIWHCHTGMRRLKIVYICFGTSLTTVGSSANFPSCISHCYFTQVVAAKFPTRPSNFPQIKMLNHGIKESPKG
jgi:hypothetical protein